MNQALRLLNLPLRLRDALRAESASATTVAEGFAHRADIGGAAGATDGVTKFTVVLLSSVNAAMWWVYTESRLMGTVWAMIVDQLCYLDEARRGATLINLAQVDVFDWA